MAIDGSCARGVDYLGQWDTIGVEDGEVWAGCVGRDIATRAAAFKRLQNELPDVNQILMTPDSAPVPEDVGARFLVTTTLATMLDANNFGTILKYLQRMPQTLRAYSFQSAFYLENAKAREGKLAANHRRIHTSRDFTAWILSTDGQEIMGKIKA